LTSQPTKEAEVAERSGPIVGVLSQRKTGVKGPGEGVAPALLKRQTTFIRGNMGLDD